MERQHTIRLENAVPRLPEARLAHSVSLDIQDNEQIAIMGENAAGKSLLVDMLTGKYPLLEGTLQYDFAPSPWSEVYRNIKYITFRDTYGSNDTNYYYQQRWNSTETDDFPTAGELLGSYEHSEMQRQLFDMFQIDGMLGKRILMLSSGELRKFQLVKMLLQRPRVLIMDNPFIGLDAATRQLLDGLLRQLTLMGGLQIILVLSMLDSVPDYITHVIPVSGLSVGAKISRDEYLNRFAEADRQRTKADKAVYKELTDRILALPYTGTNFTGDEVVRLNKVSIRYGEHTILRDLNWTVHRGERWSLSGENGSGKSTLLSLVCADNPQSYACDISLFGRQRGTGESIWEIKKHIGYVSPEMHRAYLKNLPAIDIVASGLHDSIGLYVRPRPEQRGICQWWMEMFGIGTLADHPFLRLSSGEQRLVLLARAFVKDPELLILDEPLHGLDTYNRRRTKAIIEAFCHRRDKTVIMVTHYANELPPSIDRHLTLVKKNKS